MNGVDLSGEDSCELLMIFGLGLAHHLGVIAEALEVAVMVKGVAEDDLVVLGEVEVGFVGGEWEIVDVMLLKCRCFLNACTSTGERYPRCIEGTLVGQPLMQVKLGGKSSQLWM